MKFTINRNLFIENLNNVMRAISSRATIPILSGIKLDLTDTDLTLTGSELSFIDNFTESFTRNSKCSIVRNFWQTWIIICI